MPPLHSHPHKVKKLIRVVTVPISLKHLIRGQAAYFADLGYNVLLVSADGPELDAVRNNESVPHCIIPFSRKITPLRDIYCLFLLVRLFIKEKPDIIHTQTPKAGLLGMIAGWICGVPKRVHTVGGLPIMTATGLRRRILQVTESVTASCAHQVLANSHKMAEYMVQTKLCDPGKLYVLGKGSSNGIDTGYFSDHAIQESRHALRKRFEIPAHAFVFLFIGRLVKDKGVGELVQAFDQLSMVYPDIFLVLAGPEEPELDPLSNATLDIIHHHPRIKYLGYQPDVRPFIKLSDLLLFPSYREGFPNVPLQAASMNLPAIVSNINGCNEIITDRQNGWIVEPKDSEGLAATMERILQNPVELKAAASVAREMVNNHYSQAFIWRQLADLYARQETISLFTGPKLQPIIGGRFHQEDNRNKAV